MLKKYTFFLIALFSFSGIAFSQGQSNSNSIEVAQVASPIANFNYSNTDSVAFVVRIRNMGPNALEPIDTFLISYSIASNDTFYSRDTFIVVGQAMPVDRILQYTILNKIEIADNASFSACTDVTGTTTFPINTNKLSNACNSFIVGIEEIKPIVERVFYAEGKLNFKISHPSNLDAFVYDLTGRVLVEKNIRPQIDKSIRLSNPSKGFYFLKLVDRAGNSTITKFIIN